jgi:hypothetical protein
MNIHLGVWEGPQPPEGFTAPPFDCPEGSDFAASQITGMCVGPDYDPVYSQVTPGGPRYYYNLDGSVGGTWQAPQPPKSTIPGIANAYIYAAAGVLALVLFMKGRR